MKINPVLDVPVIFSGDTIAPTCVLTSAATSPVISLFSATATFSEDVTGFAVGDITVTNGSASNFAGSGAVYTFDVTPNAIGTLTIQVGAGVCTDLAGNLNTASNTLSYTSLFSVVHWVKADDLATLYQDSAKTTPVASEGNPVGAWVDQIAAEYVQATTGAKPTYRASVAALGNKPALQFDGGDYLQGAFTGALSQPTTIFIVGQSTGDTGAFLDGDDSTHRNLVDRNATTTWRLYAGTSVAGGSADASAHILTALFNGALSTLHEDGVLAISNNPGAQVLDGLSIGSNNAGAANLTGHIAEILIYQAALSAADKNTVQNYLAAKYNISVTEFS